MSTFLPTYITNRDSCMTDTDTDTHACLPSFIHTRICTYIHKSAYIYTWKCVCMQNTYMHVCKIQRYSYISVYIYACIFTLIYACIHPCMWLHKHIHRFIHIHINIYIHICTYAFMHVSLYTILFTCIHSYIYVCMHTYRLVDVYECTRKCVHTYTDIHM